MAPRQRRGKSKGLPPNLYAQTDTRSGGTYYRYLGPDGKWYGLGTDRREAIRQASDANVRRAGSAGDLWQRISETEVLTVAQWCDEFEAICHRRGLAENTKRGIASRVRRIRAGLGKRNLPDLTTRHCSKFLAAIREEGKHRLSQAVRSILKDMLNEAIAEGHIRENVAAITRAETVEVQRKRLTLETFMKIHKAAGQLDPWAQRSMELALVSAQPREVISAAQFSDVKEGAWWCRRGKTDVQIMIPLGLRLDAVGWSLGEVIRACRDNVVSRYLIHHRKPHGNAPPGSNIFIDTVSRRFAEARKLAGIKGDNPPTFHEIRSLSQRLYSDQGIDTQALLGHKDPRTTAIYNDRRGAEWIRVKVD